MPQSETAATCIDPSLLRRAEKTVRGLRDAGLSVVTAESCTGGLIAAVLSQVEGAGDVLEGGFVVYSKQHKTRALAVDSAILSSQGAINAATAEQMVMGALDRSFADLALAVTGVLGPEPDEDGNPVGLVYLAVGRRNQAYRTEKHAYGRQPHDILRRRVVTDALTLLDGLI